MSLRKITNNRGIFPSGEALLKPFYLALRPYPRPLTNPYQSPELPPDRTAVHAELLA